MSATTDSTAPAAAIHVAAADAEAIAFLGGRIDVRLAAEHTGGWLCVHDSRLPAGTMTPLHVHPADEESFVVLEGLVEFVLDGRRVEAGPGSALHIPRGVPHAFRVVSPAGARLLGLGTPAGHERFFRAAGDPFAEAADGPAGPPDLARMGAAAEAAGFRLLGPPPFDLG